MSFHLLPGRFIAVLALVFVSSIHQSVGQDAKPSVPPVLLQMIRDTAIHEELRLTSIQQTQVSKAIESLDGRWFRSRMLPPAKQQPELDSLTTLLRQNLQQVLTPKQTQRLAQLERQALGTRMLTRDDVAEALKLSPYQRQEFDQAFVEADEKANALQQKLRKGDVDAAEAQQQIAKLKESEQALLAENLSTEQRAKIGTLAGQPFDFAKITRRLPMAPELTGKGVTWIQGGPLKLSQLKGKVVAVHYYAFQCINCRRNLPHYKAWHEDYADKGLVIIGIQSPETPAEKKLPLVSAAAKSEGIKYPVFLDSEKANWETWNNRIWPTVYLIDKQGFLRRWWTGEMNWQGNEGEKAMRQTIEQLLAEDASS